MNIFEQGVTQISLPDTERCCTIIDGMALVQALGKPHDCDTFGDLADAYTRCVFLYFSHSERADVLFDRCFSMSIKCGTRQHRLGSERTISKIIDRRDVKLPEYWKRFIGMNENKVNLANFLSNQLVEAGQGIEKELVVSGGFKEISKAVSNKRDVPMLCASHEEADTRIPLHEMDVKSQGNDMMFVVSPDTDVLVMLTAFASELTEEIWMKVGTSKRPRYIRVHDKKLPVDMRKGLVAFHALTWCDSTSQFAGITKKSSWKVFEKSARLLKGFAVDLSKDEKMMSAVEAFVFQMYCPTSSATDIQVVRSALLRKCKTNRLLTPYKGCPAATSEESLLSSLYQEPVSSAKSVSTFTIIKWLVLS